MEVDDDFGDEFGDDDGFEDDDGGWGDTELISAEEQMVKSALNDKDKQKESNDNEKENDKKEEKEEVNWTCREMVEKFNEETHSMEKKECGFVNKVHPTMCQSCGAINLGMAASMMDENQKKEGAFWSKLYAKVYLKLHSKNRDKLLNWKDIREIMDAIFVHESIGLHVTEFRKADDEKEANSIKKCVACDGVFDKEAKRCKDLKCHSDHCKECIGNWTKSLIDREMITPYLKCPSKTSETFDDKTKQLVIETCDKAIPICVLFDKEIGLSLINLYSYASMFCQLRLGAVKKWVQCPNNKASCKYGILFSQADDAKKVAKCESCGMQATYELEHEFDLETQKWIKEGKVRLCPKCELPHMKDKGLCNVMKCGKCGIWWNWRTKETASTEGELKQIARRNRTLWEPGELEYQQKLQKENLPEFIKLLAKNGIKYDPNYARGS